MEWEHKVEESIINYKQIKMRKLVNFSQDKQNLLLNVKNVVIKDKKFSLFLLIPLVYQKRMKCNLSISFFLDIKILNQWFQYDMVSLLIARYQLNLLLNLSPNN